MVQQGCFDYYYEGDGSGCCLHCPNKYPGCLCYECKCTKCFWYSSPGETGGDKGICDLVEELKEESKNKWIEMMERKREFENRTYLKLQRLNQELKKFLEDNNKIINHYSCKNCGFQFVSGIELFNDNIKCLRCRNG